ncbi:40S ribosomal protein S6 [Pseudoloma neurophilia]|uniref:40S ribosomal protein S6 n=1 Tax=Pseudoloma neurophilia TaxID=146866 RepID=A0A0R0M8F8_9MICR|nr:40S ribosomal protein S6 [Pseudoloma neurophilia]
MKLNIASPQTNSIICIEVTGNIERSLYGKSLGDVIDAGLLKPEFAGWQVQFTGGSDKQGFPMDSARKTDKRQRLLRKKGNIGYKPKKKGERKRKSVRGAVISEEIAVLCMKIVNDPIQLPDPEATGPEAKHIEGLTDGDKIGSHLPKRLTKLHRELFSHVPNFKELNENQIREHVKTLVAQKSDSKKQMPRLRVTRIRSPHFQERLQKRLDDNQKRKEKSEAIKAEFLQKYPGWKIAE